MNGHGPDEDAEGAGDVERLFVGEAWPESSSVEETQVRSKIWRSIH